MATASDGLDVLDIDDIRDMLSVPDIEPTGVVDARAFLRLLSDFPPPLGCDPEQWSHFFQTARLCVQHVQHRAAS